MIEIEKIERQDDVFAVLNRINVNEHTEQKGGLTYLSWAWAWAKVKEHFPEAIYTIYENPDGWNYFTDGRTAWVKTGVTINGLEHIEYLPVMDFKNRSLPLEAITSTDVNKTIQRSLTKACARHGLGLYIYAGEDLPEEEKREQLRMDEKISGKDAEILRNTLTSTQTEWVRKTMHVEDLAELTNRQFGKLMQTLRERDEGKATAGEKG